MPKQIKVSITVNEAMLTHAINQSGLRIVDTAAFTALFKDKSFAEDLSRDMLHVWTEANKEDRDGFHMILGDCVDLK
jgi:hypothetical protein